MANKRFLYSWLAGAVFLLGLFYAANAWLWDAARNSAAASLERQVGAVLAADLAEGNLFKLGASLARLMQAGSLDYAEIRSRGPGGWERVYRTRSDYGDTGELFEGFACGAGRRLARHAGQGVRLVTTLPANIEGADCVALLVSSDLPGELKAFRRRLTAAFALLLAGLLLLFLRLTLAWHKKELAFEVVARTAEAEKEAAIGRMAAQVAHDIRSPLAALEAGLGGLDALPQEKRDLVRGALGRIGGIAAGLLGTYRGGGAPEPHDLLPLAAAVLAEKRAQHAARAGLVFSLQPEGDIFRAAVQPAEFQRLLSNLLNNAAEAVAADGRVDVLLNKEPGRIVLRVRDDGKGIPADLLPKLGAKGGTHGKAGGTGLGLYHARTCAEAWGGTFALESGPGAGTTVTLALPEAAPPEGPRSAVLIDDDPLVRLNWKTAARAAGAELRVYSSAEEFRAAGPLPKETPVFIDSDLGGGVKGEEEAVKLREEGWSDLTLETGHPPEKFAALPWLRVRGKEPPWG